MGFKEADKVAVLKGMAVESAPPRSPSFKDGTDKELTPAVKQLLEELEGKLKDGQSGVIAAASLQKVLAEMVRPSAGVYSTPSAPVTLPPASPLRTSRSTPR